MNGKIAHGLEAVRALTSSWAAGESSADVSELTRAVMQAADLGGEHALMPLWAAGRLAEDEPLARRAISFAIARFASDFDQDRWLPALWLLAPPHPYDLSTIQNSLTTLQRHPDLSGVALRVVCREVGPFLVHALRRSSNLTEGVTDVLYAYLDSDKLQHVLTAPAAATLTSLLLSLPDATPDPVIESARTMAGEIRARSFPDEFPGVAEDLRTFLDSRAVPAETDEWSKVLRWTDEGVREFIEHYAAFEDLSALATAQNLPTYDLRISGRWASLGKLPIDFLEKSLHTWRRLYTEVRSAPAGEGEQPCLFVLAPARGSFVVRVLVDVAEPGLELEARTAEQIVASVESTLAADDPLDRTRAAPTQDYALLRLAAEQGVDVEIGIAVPGAAGGRHRVRVSHVRARSAVARLAAARPSSAAPTETIGVLEGANHRTGKFEMRPAEGDAIVGTVARGGRGLLLDKTIGSTYQFGLNKVTDQDGGEKWELSRLTAIPGEVRTDARTASDVLEPPPKVITSAVVPQADSLERITQAVEIVARGEVLSTETIDLSSRHVAYNKQAARLLHLLSEDGKLLRDGATLVALAPARRFDHLAIQFEVSICGQAWMKWARVTCVADLDPETAFAFLRKRSDLTKTMIERRGRTLRRWARDLGKHGFHDADEE